MLTHHDCSSSDCGPWTGRVLDFFSALRDENRTLGIQHLQDLIELENRQPYPLPFLEGLRSSLQKNDWNLLSRPFVTKEFVGNRGRFLWVAPYWFRGQTAPRLIGIAGHVVGLPKLDEESLETHMNGLVCGSFRVPEVLPVEIRFSFGPEPDLDCEVLLAPEQWFFRAAGLGPALEQIRLRESSFRSRMQNAIPSWATPWGDSSQEMRVTLHFLERFREVATAIAPDAPERRDEITLELVRRSLDRSTASKVASALFCQRIPGISEIRSGSGSQSGDSPQS